MEPPQRSLIVQGDMLTLTTASWLRSDGHRAETVHLSESEPLRQSGWPFVILPQEIIMPPVKKAAAPAKAAPQPTVTLKHMAAALAEAHDLPKKQAETM